MEVNFPLVLVSPNPAGLSSQHRFPLLYYPSIRFWGSLKDISTGYGSLCEFVRERRSTKGNKFCNLSHRALNRILLFFLAMLSSIFLNPRPSFFSFLSIVPFSFIDSSIFDSRSFKSDFMTKSIFFQYLWYPHAPIFSFLIFSNAFFLADIKFLIFFELAKFYFVQIIQHEFESIFIVLFLWNN